MNNTLAIQEAPPLTVIQCGKHDDQIITVKWTAVGKFAFGRYASVGGDPDSKILRLYPTVLERAS